MRWRLTRPAPGARRGWLVPASSCGTTWSRLRSPLPSPAAQVSEERSTVATLDRVREVVAEKLDVPVDDVKLASRFVEDLRADSLDQVELIMALEDEYDITIPDEDAQKLVTVQDAVTYIDKSQAK
ncbi:MAG: acyl carrier protein [Actinobacteria bacterium]|nr:acyl carrier protein [Actinomycetota bacterium]